MTSYHTPVLLNEIITWAPEQIKIAVDFTLGGGGHAKKLLETYPNLFLYAIDRDIDAIQASQQNLSLYHKRIEFIHAPFSQATQILLSKNIQADYIIADLGVSSFQINQSHRGFSFSQSGPLDMRMSQTDTNTASDIIHYYSVEQLRKIFQQYGEEKFANKIAREIVNQRNTLDLTTTGSLASFIKDILPKRWKPKLHPATLIFQALRIEVNQELQELKEMFENVLAILKKNGRLSIITFHSLEDRIVKQTYRDWEKSCECPKEFPICICNKKPLVKRLHKKIIVPTNEEIQRNIRSRSAKLRVCEKL